MIKKTIYCVALASLVLATSCSQDESLKSDFSQNEINVTPSLGVTSRAVETTINNLGTFQITSFQDGQANYMNKVDYTSTDQGKNWTTQVGKFYWPASGNLHFYGYSPVTPGQAGNFTISKDAQKLNDFIPNTAAKDQKDFVYAKSTGNAKSNGSTGIGINFQHALSQISITAKNENTAYTVDVTGVCIGNITSKGTFTFPAPSGGAASWAPSSDTNAKQNYTTTWNTAVRLGASESQLDASNVPFMLIPQQLTKSAKASERAYLALKVKITMQGGTVIHNGWTYVGIDTNWEMGKKYIYILDLSNGVGQDENGNKIFSESEIKVYCDVASWNEAIKFDGIYDSNCLLISPESYYYNKYYGIDVKRANTFWSNTDVGDASNVITENTEWEAEVIWQDIPSRAINFCDASGKTINVDKYEGKGLEPFYVKTTKLSNKGNVLVGIKKKGAGADSYLWSWHLWITDEPKLISGFMDRNLGAISAIPSDREKTFGLYYQFGRKDPFVGDVDIYDINGTKIQNGATLAKGKVTFAKAVNTPYAFYTENYPSGMDWASPNNYTAKNWNDITGAAGKTFFDPCPKGWKMPEISAYSEFYKFNVAPDYTNKGRLCNGNWFNSPGRRIYGSGDGKLYLTDCDGCFRSVTPHDSESGYMMINGFPGSVSPKSWFPRQDGESVRCIKD